MKNLHFAFLAISFLFIFSCKKTDNPVEQEFADFSGQLANQEIQIPVGNRTVKALLTKKTGDKMDLVLGLHGGSGTMEQSISSTEGFAQKEDAGQIFIEKDFAVLALEYTEFDEDGNKATRGILEMEEVLAAVDFIQNGGLEKHNIEVDRFFAFGHSRGGGNALLAGIERTLDGVISTEGPLDWIATYDSTEAQILTPNPEQLAFFYASTEAWGDPHIDPTLWEKYSPGLRVEEFKTPFLVISGEHDDAILLSSVYRMKNVYDNCSNCVDGGHFVIHPQGHTDWAMPMTLQAIDVFVGN